MLDFTVGRWGNVGDIGRQFKSSTYKYFTFTLLKLLFLVFSKFGQYIVVHAATCYKSNIFRAKAYME